MINYITIGSNDLSVSTAFFDGLFGALGDLAQRKLFPALYQLERAGLLADGSRILGLARRELSTDDVRKELREGLKQYVKPEEFDELARLAKELGFKHVASGPLVRSSYHADKQAKGEALPVA